MQLELKTAVIIQARLGSTRLPGKVLYKVMGKTILEYVIERAGKARSIEETIVATTTSSEDSQIADLADKSGARVYRGSEQDVLDRYYQAAKLFGIKHIVRITADCPLIDPEIVDKVVGHYFDTKSDYCSNVIAETFPDGQDVEVFGFDTLSDAWKNAKLLSEREHVTPYIRKSSGKFKLASFRNSVDLSGKRWTLDE
ncbi:MAG: glycosyltransferase family protein, partial [Candidatus Omnitrophota bacterium]|nr:glycosyltransferase family protein [Candidatus Omnitrophota bacterium]